MRDSVVLPRHTRRPRPLRTRIRARLRRLSRPKTALLVVPLLVVVLATAAWGVDTAVGGDVTRNVELAGRDVGGSATDELRTEIEAYARDVADTPVRLVTSQGELPTTAGALGVTVDVDATAAAALDAGKGFPLLRPLQWAASFVAPHDVTPVLSVDVGATYQEVVALEGTTRIPPVEPTMAVQDGAVALVPGQPGSGIDAEELAARLPDAVLEGVSPVVINIEPSPLPPATTDEAVRAVVDEANLVTDVALRVRVAGDETEVSPEDQRAWLRLVGATGAPDSPAPSLALDEEAALADLAERFPDLGEPPVDARVTLGDDGVPVVIPGTNGTGCCEPGSGDRLLTAMREGSPTVELDATSRPPERTTEEVQSWAIVGPVGGARAWPESRSGEVGPGFTTFHAAGEARVTNIHRIADLVRGAVVPPGGTFSVNDHVGRRTRENGFVAAGAIRNGEHVSEVGGGVSQFATTLFNAAYFAGLDIVEYQAHSEYFSRYPRGREATMGFPAPDLEFRNNTPFGVLIWTSYTGSSLTITLYSSPFIVAEQTDINEGRSGNCDVVSTERTRTFPDGSQQTDTFRATYRPGPGQFC